MRFDEWGRVVKGVNTTPDVNVNSISQEAAKLGFNVDKDGKPPLLSKKVSGPTTNVLSNIGLTKTSVSETIRKVTDNKWRLYSKKGKNLGTFNSLAAAKKHEREVQYFKHNEGKFTPLELAIMEDGHSLHEDVTPGELNSLEKILDKVFGSIGIDVNFTRHFLDRINDPRNETPISIKELAMLFKKEYQQWGRPIAQMGPDKEAVMKDLASDINVPFALTWDRENNELDMIAKTIMRKKNFHTPNKEFSVEAEEGYPKTLNIEEGVNDPDIFKAVFLVGGPGSGKSHVASKVLAGNGLKNVNSDEVYEFLMRKAGLNLDAATIASPQGQKIRDEAKRLDNTRMGTYINGRLGLILDGTGKSVEKIQKQAEMLRQMGYSTMMIFVNTSLDIAQARNLQRARQIPSEMVSKMWNTVQENLMKFQQIFGSGKFYIIDNSGGLEDLDRKQNFDKVYNETQRFLNTPPRSKAALAWIQNQKAQNDDKRSERTTAQPTNTNSDGGVGTSN